MKRIHNLLFLMVLLMAVFALPGRVSAIGEPEIQGITIKQGNTVLAKEGEYYVAPGADRLYVTYDIINLPAYGMGVYIEVLKEGDYWPSSSGSYYSGYASDLYVDLYNEYVTYSIKLCEDSTCDNIYDTLDFTVKFTLVTESVDDVVYFSKIMQGGSEVAFDDETDKFILNDLQDATFFVKAENLTPDVNYKLICNGYKQEGYNYESINEEETYTGTQLMNGVEHTCVLSKFQGVDSFNFGYGLGSGWTNMNYWPDLDYNYFYPTIELQADENIKSYEATLKYTDYDDALSRVDDDYWGNTWHYLALSSMFNADKTLSMYVKGTDFDNKNYNVVLSIFKNSEKIYTRNKSVAGSALNSGYNAEYEEFDPGTEAGVRYKFVVTIDGVSHEADVEYLYSDKELTITRVAQGETNSLNKVDGVYIAPGRVSLYVYLGISNYNPKDEYYIGLGSGVSRYYPNEGIHVRLDEFENETEDFTVKLCADWECDEIVTFTSLKVRLTQYNAVMNQKIYFYDVKQAGTSIPMGDSGAFNINNQQEVTVMMKGENLINGAKYILSLGDYTGRREVTASALAAGVLVTGDPKDSGWLHVSVEIDDFQLDPQYYDGTDYYYEGQQIGYNTIYFNFNTSETYNKSYEATLKYKNYPDIEIEVADEYYVERYAINSNYHNSNNPLRYYIEGSGYDNTNYTVNVKVLQDYENEIYNHDFTVSGSDLNSGTNIDLTGFALPFPDDIDELTNGTNGMPWFYFYITIDHVKTSMVSVYNSAGSNLSVDAEIFFENGKKNLSVFRGFGNSGMYDTNVDVFRKYSKIYMNFMGTGFEDDEEYNYYVDYGYYTEGTDLLNFPNTVTSGKVTGEILNNVGVFVELNNSKNYQHPTYRFYVKKGNEILAFTAPVIYTTEMATLANVMLKTQDRDLYLYTDSYSYIATKNMPISIEVAGIGFEDNGDYEFEYCHAELYEDPMWGLYSDNSVCDDISFNGKDLNDGTVTIDFSEDNIGADVVGYTFSVYGEGEGYFGQGFFTVQFVENKELLPTINKYIIEDASDIIKNVSKQTTVTEFKNNITVVEGRTFKVFDKTGTTEITGQIGTGMQGRVIDEYDRNIINIGIAVKGDITGDGEISLTDLVKVKKHLIETELLEDVYEAAGNVDGTGAITPTDLVKMCQDVTGIEELS